MEVEIIKTDNPDIVIERTTIEKEINLALVREQISFFEDGIVRINNQIEQLNQSKQGLPDFIISVIDEKILKLSSEIETNKHQIQLLTQQIGDNG